MDKRFLYVVFFILIAVSIAPGDKSVRAQTSAQELRQNIDNHTEKIKKLDEEIKTYSKQIEQVGSEATNLQNAIKILDIDQKKITTEIKKTELNISNTNSKISSLSEQIKKIEVKLTDNQKAISKTLNEIRIQDDTSLIENFLVNKSFSEIIDEYQILSQLQSNVRAQSIALLQNQNELNEKRLETEKKKSELVSFKSELGDQNQILSNNKKEKNTLLTETKNKEAVYKSILAEKQAQKEQFEKDLFAFEAALKKVIDPNSFPSGKKGILAPPLENIFVTQAFGRTVDARRLYTSGTHNGVDFRAARGTKVMSVLDGTVKGTGNTDAQKGCYSYGKWILIEHPNGLTSLYAHLDLIKVTSGQQVSTGEVIGYSGATGYATGPHLHFTLLASQGVSVQQYTSSKNCKNTFIPVSAQNAYLDPMLYF